MTSPTRPSRRRRVLWLVVIDVTLVLAAIELVPRWVAIPGLTLADLDPPQVRSDERRRVQPHPYLSYSLKPHWRSAPGSPKSAAHNSLGFRGPEVEVEKPAGTFRVLCIGGSSTYGSAPSSNERTYPARLQHHLRRGGCAKAEVVNLGCTGWTSTESLVNLALRGLELEPDLVVVYHGYNDALAAMWKDPVWDQTHYRASWTDLRESPLERWLANSRLYLIARAYLTDHLQWRLDQQAYLEVGFDPGYSEPDPDRHVPERGVKTFLRNLRSIVVLSRDREAEVVFMEQAFHPGEGTGPSPKSGALRRRVLGRMLEAQRGLAAELEVPLFGMAGVLEEAARVQLERDGRQQLFNHNVHLRDPGADLLARSLAEELIARGLVPTR